MYEVILVKEIHTMAFFKGTTIKKRSLVFDDCLHGCPTKAECEVKHRYSRTRRV